MLGQPTTMTLFDESKNGDRVLVYADEPVRARVALTDGRVSEIALEFVYIDGTSLPAHARMVKPTMVRGGVLALLGRPSRDDKWTTSGLEMEQMLFARTGEADFSVFLADGLVIDVRPGAERPSNLQQVILPATIPDSAVGTDLRIGLNPRAGCCALGPPAWMTTSTFKGQPVLNATYCARDWHHLASLTFTGDVLTAFAFWPSNTNTDLGDPCYSADHGSGAATSHE